MGLSVKNLSIDARMKSGAVNHIASGISFDLQPGGRLAIVGRSGCGKTMTAMSILGLLPDNCTAQGSILWDGLDLLSLPAKQRRRLCGTKHVLIPQSGADFLNPSLSVGRQMRECLAINNVPRQLRTSHCLQLLKQVGFDNGEKLLRAYPFQLSGGMAQRLVMAMASAGEPELVIADEPTKGIDQHNTRQFIDNLGSLFPSAAVIIITHDISLAAVCESILVMKDGRVEEYGDTQQILRQPASLYTHRLICDLPHALSHAERGMHHC